MQHKFANEGKYVDVEFACYTQDENLHIVQNNVEHGTQRTYEVGRVCFNSDEFFQIYNALVQSGDNKFNQAAQYATILLNMNGYISINTARELWRIATNQVDNFLVLVGTKTETFRVLALESSEEQIRLEESFGDAVAVSCRHGKITVKRRGFK